MGQELNFWSKRVFASIILSATIWHFDVISDLSSADAKAAAGVVAQISVTMLGFVLAALAILMSIGNSRLVRNMKKTGHYKVLTKRMFGSLAAFGALAIFGLMLLLSPFLSSAYIYPLIVLLLISIFVLYDVARKFWTVLNHLNPSEAQ